MLLYDTRVRIKKLLFVLECNTDRVPCRYTRAREEEVEPELVRVHGAVSLSLLSSRDATPRTCPKEKKKRVTICETPGAPREREEPLGHVLFPKKAVVCLFSFFFLLPRPLITYGNRILYRRTPVSNPRCQCPAQRSKKPSDTGDSRVIPQPSTNPAQPCLSSMF